MFRKKKQLKMELDDLKEKNENLFARVVKLEAENKELRDNYEILVEDYHKVRAERDSYCTKIEHIKELNKNRQRKYRENKKSK